MRLTMPVIVMLLAAGAMTLSAAPALEKSAEPALITAAKASDARTIRSLIVKKTDIEVPAADSSTALHIAVQNNNLEIADLLLKAGAKVEAATRYKVTPLSMAAANGNTAMIERLIAGGANPNGPALDGQTPLMTAARNGKTDAMRMLLKNGAKVGTVEPYRGQTALMWAAGEGNTGALDLLIEFGADIKAKSKGGYTALLLAVLNNQTEAVKLLVAHGANVEDKAPDGTTALNMAAVNCFYDLGALLLDLGANPNAPDPRGSTLHTVVWLNKPGTSWEAAGLGQDPETVPRPEGRLNAYSFARRLLEKGANPNKRVDFKEMPMTKGLGTTRNPPNINLGRHHMSFVGTTPFYNAARNGDAPMMRLLLEFKADPKITNNVGVTPLMAAAGIDYYEGESPGPRTGVSEAERLEAVKLAFETGGGAAVIDQKTHLGDYPMIGSAEFTLLTYPENMDDLLNLGVGDPRWDGMTALHSAILSNQPSLVQFMVDQGADPEMKTRLGWTPLMITKGIFMANSKKEFPAAAKIIEEAIARKRAAGK